MTENELMTLMGVMTDPEKNVYNLNDRKNKAEIERIIRIFNISHKQRVEHKMLSIKKLATFRLVMSNN